jgi:hypothetical protein
VVGIYDAHHARVQFANSHHLTVNGLGPDLKFLAGSDTFTVPRPHANGRYTIIYTDEHGQQTSFIVLAPARDLAITSPAAHTRIPIPLPGAQVAMEYSLPYPASSAIAGPPIQTRVDAGVEGHCNAGRPDGIPTSALSCINVDSGQQDGTGCALISDTRGPQGSGYGFDNLAAGPGELYVDMTVTATFPQSGFASVSLYLRDVATLPITWV